jgi:DNA-binding MarR family transcriptional regulator
MPSRRAPAARPTPSPGPPACEELNLLYLIGRVDRVVRREIDSVVRAHGLSAAQYTTLSVLSRRGGLSNAQLARRALVSSQSMNEVLLALEQRGLVSRRAHPEHGRIRQTRLTAKGRKTLALCDAEVHEVETTMVGELDRGEQTALHRALLSCVRSLHGGLALD